LIPFHLFVILFHFMIAHCRIMGWLVNNELEESLQRKGRGLNWGDIPTSGWRDCGKPRRTSFTTASVWEHMTHICIVKNNGFSVHTIHWWRQCCTRVPFLFPFTSFSCYQQLSSSTYLLFYSTYICFHLNVYGVTELTFP
jgi:hypothetical protein